jgi:formylglycine-generating enzyme required for sulfatase activity
MAQSGLAQGWTWWTWPFAASIEGGSWHYLHEAGTQWCMEFGNGQWSRLGLTAAGDGEYLVVDLSPGSTASDYPVSYLSAVPDGGWTDEYKTTKLVLRRIPAGTFTMGSPANEFGREADEAQHEVTLTQPFYIGVFEVTQKQWDRVMGTRPSGFTNTNQRDTRPVEQITYYGIRGWSGADSGWPTNADVDADAFMGRLRTRTGRAFDLPTEAQWEYAGRGGASTALNSGREVTDWNVCTNMSDVGRYWGNGGSGYAVDGLPGTAGVGSYQANPWGLYDIHGNVWEWCLDWHGSYAGTATNPRGPTSGLGRVNRGGGWFDNPPACRAAHRFYYPPAEGHFTIGFRAAAPQGR